MKKFFVGLVVLALSVVGILGGEQKFSSLPIGANLDGYISSIQILVVGDGLDASAWQSYPYNRTYDGKLETFAAQKLREYTASIIPANETSLYGWTIHAVTDGIGGLLPSYNGEGKPATIAVAPLPDEREEARFRFTLRNGHWEVPEEVFGKVRFQFGAAPGYYIAGPLPDTRYLNLEVNLFNGNKVSRFSTKEGVSDADNPCILPATLWALNTGLVIIPEEIATARPSWWEYAEITLYTNDGESVTFLVNRTTDDGKAIRWSTPPPPFFVPPTPKIASLKRAGDVTEIVVERSGAVLLEFSENLREWHEVQGSRIALASEGAPVVIRHETAAPSGFYRLRILDGVQ